MMLTCEEERWRATPSTLEQASIRETIKLADGEFRFRTKVNRVMRFDNREH